MRWLARLWRRRCWEYRVAYIEPPWYFHVNQIAADGWELAFIVAQPDGSYDTCVFKRRRRV